MERMARGLEADVPDGSMSTGSKPVPSKGSCSVPSPSFSFSALITPNRSISNAKSLRVAAMDKDMSHGENAWPDLVYTERASKAGKRYFGERKKNIQLETSFKASSILEVLQGVKTTRQTRSSSANSPCGGVSHDNA